MLQMDNLQNGAANKNVKHCCLLHLLQMCSVLGERLCVANKSAKHCRLLHLLRMCSGLAETQSVVARRPAQHCYQSLLKLALLTAPWLQMEHHTIEKPVLKFVS
jgi:hypothetical protein